jgi:hypothetical protein
LPENCSQGLLAGSVYQGNNMTMKNNFPKFLLAVLAGCFAASVQAQLPPEGRPNDARVIVNPQIGPPSGVPSARQETRFDLNFKGGTPKQFIEAIKAQSGLKVNVIIPHEEADAQLPAMEVSNVTLAQLFAAVSEASSVATNIIRGTFKDLDGRTHPSWATFRITKEFRTRDKALDESSIWYFHVTRPEPTSPTLTALTNAEQISVRVYQMALLLNEYSIDDVLTAAKTAWQMLDSSSSPEMKYHSDTKLLVVKGTDEQQKLIRSVMGELELTVRAKSRQAQQSPSAAPRGEVSNP